MGDIAKVRDAAKQVKDALDRINQIKNNPDQVQKAVEDARAKVDQLVQQASQD
jgi:hypothetical protein